MAVARLTSRMALVHPPVARGAARARFVVHRRSGWMVGGPNFIDLDEARYVRRSMRSLVERDPSLAQVLDLPVGYQAWRHEASRPWTRERAPRGRTFVVTWEVKPTRRCGLFVKAAGAAVNCWVRANSFASARRVTRRDLSRDGWRVLEEIAACAKRPGDLAAGTEPYFRQVQVDGSVFVIHWWPRRSAVR